VTIDQITATVTGVVRDCSDAEAISDDALLFFAREEARRHARVADISAADYRAIVCAARSVLAKRALRQQQPSL
jgi:hypothetical protein